MQEPIGRIIKGPPRRIVVWTYRWALYDHMLYFTHSLRSLCYMSFTVLYTCRTCSNKCQFGICTALLGIFQKLYSYSTEDELLCQDGFANSKKYMWNNLPLHLKRSNSLSIFKNRLLNYLFENYITMCYKPNCYSCKTN